MDELKKVIEANYNINVVDLEKVKNVYRIKTGNGIYCLKVIKYKFPHFLFIISAIKHLQSRGFDRVPQLLKRYDGEDFIQLGSSNAYLTDWIEARECNYDNPLDISQAAMKLAELHNCSEGFEVTEKMQPRIYWHKWIEHFNTRRDEILDFKRRIDKKNMKTEFDYLYLKGMEAEIKRAEKSVEDLLKSGYIEKVNVEKPKGGFCHHDYAHHNILMEPDGKISIIDFDYCILDINLHDLGSLLIRRMKNGGWETDDAVYILDNYSKVRTVENKDIPILAAFMEFPQDYWQVGIQYYWEEQPWGEEFFLKKLKKIYEDVDVKQEFINEFRQLKYNF